VALNEILKPIIILIITCLDYLNVISTRHLSEGLLLLGSHFVSDLHKVVHKDLTLDERSDLRIRLQKLHPVAFSDIEGVDVGEACVDEGGSLVKSKIEA
jgi:hypothetical protein